jgi:hypothetical protein
LSRGSNLKVLSELELEGVADILTQLLKLSEDNSIDPEQLVLDVLVVTEVISIDSEKVTDMLSFIKIEQWFSIG